MIFSRRDTDTIARLRLQISQKEAVIQEQASALVHSRKIFDRSSAAARLGVWQCSLPDNALEWTDVVYDIFDLPRGSILDRSEIVKCYSEASARNLNTLRSKAIAERNGFTMDAEIITAMGNRRWIRITATVECEDAKPVRIFGIKQDITDEKITKDRTQYLAAFDVMTGLANRAQFQSKLGEFCDDYGRGDTPRALILVDLDGFKTLNDTFGHSAGDDCLRETARHLERVCTQAALIARIGGDEFAILVNENRDSVSNVARNIVRALYRPVHLEGRQVQIGASVGIAFMDGSTPSELFKKADVALYAAKAAGRNTFEISGDADDDVGHRATDAA
ncbi:sensor domain-containing diguanylate cyclase [Rhizobium herbae]|uniref:Diguanylate cyclase (GGDEF)-like protein n=1 Tax=Rhizobium herbae TaxID=508661 RepID=A0ABS4EWN6_9HYPH|nr:sensor domain-containing diguanylate cyclase [Rhizobium herbae]MBP1862347.1 diguanylate cyclase (GGDEF)-like protein [Rhizobium herbae]